MPEFEKPTIALLAKWRPPYPPRPIRATDVFPALMTIVPFVTNRCTVWIRRSWLGVPNAEMLCMENALDNVSVMITIVFLLSWSLADGLICSGARSSTQKNNLSCVWCRAKWVLPASGGGAAGASMSEGYLNLGNAAGVDTSRDTSTCKCLVRNLLCHINVYFVTDYQGPRRGQRHYGYQDYYWQDLQESGRTLMSWILRILQNYLVYRYQQISAFWPYISYQNIHCNARSYPESLCIYQSYIIELDKKYKS